MKRPILSLLAILLATVAATARENWLAKTWTGRIERPATGTVTADTVAWRTDSVISMTVRYMASAQTPAAEYINRIPAPAPRKYRFSAWVNLTRASTSLSIALTDTGGETYRQIGVSTEGTAALVPGRWTRVEIEADLSDKPMPDALCVRLLPQWNNGVAIVTGVAPQILVSDPFLDCSDPDGTYKSDDIFNGSFEAWRLAFDGDRNIVSHWNCEATERVAGAHIVDNAVLLGPSSRINPYSESLISNKVLKFKAKAVGAAVVSLCDGNEVVDRLTVTGNRWSEYTFTKTKSNPKVLSFTTDGNCIIDDVRFVPADTPGRPHDPVMTLLVTDGGDSGPGTLRDVVETAPNYSNIVFDVNDVVLNSTISLGDKNLYFIGENKVCIHSPAKAPAFTIVPELEGMMFVFADLSVKGNADGPANGGAISVSDSRATSAMTLSLVNVSFDGCNATSSGGAVYVNSPGSSLRATDCIFSDCKAAHGAAIAVNNGTEHVVEHSKFINCASTGNIGGALTVNASARLETRVIGCVFDRCASSATTGGAGAVAVYGGMPHVTVARSLFVANSGGRASGISIYNNTRGTITGRTDVVNCTAINNTGTSPVIAMNATARYNGPNAVLVNNVIDPNDGKALEVGAGSPVGSHNLLGDCDTALPNPVTHKADQPSFLFYDNGRPAHHPDDEYLYPIWSKGALHNAGTRSYKAPDGDEIITDDVFYTNNSWGTMSVGYTEESELRNSVDDITADTFCRLWPNPVSTTLFVDGDFDRMSLTDLNGVTVYVGRASGVDVSALAPGVYIATIEKNGKVNTQKIIKR